MSGGVNAAASHCPQPAQNAMGRVQEDQSKAVDVMKKMVSGEVSASDGMKQLQALVVDQAVAVGSLVPSAASGATSSSGSGFSSRDTFEMGGGRPMMNLTGASGAGVNDTSFLDKESGGGSKPGIASGTN